MRSERRSGWGTAVGALLVMLAGGCGGTTTAGDGGGGEVGDVRPDARDAGLGGPDAGPDARDAGLGGPDAVPDAGADARDAGPGAGDAVPDARDAGPAVPDAGPDARAGDGEGRTDALDDGDGGPCEGPVAVITVDEGEEVGPGTDLHLHGEQSVPRVGAIRRWEWSVAQPVGSQSVFIPSPTFPEPTFEVNVAGTYTFYLDVWDDVSQSCEQGVYEVVVVTAEAIHVELLWTTPGDPNETDVGPIAGADVDLHFVHPNAPADPAAPDHDGDGAPDPYFDPLWDCHSHNPAPDWGAPGDETDDDPRLDRDDGDGAGPENVNLSAPENGARYEVAVHYREDNGYGASFATVRVYVYQVLVFEIRDVRLLEGDLWCVATIDWPSGQVGLCEAAEGGYRITSDYPAPPPAD